jgi:hypothetical protein
MFFEHWRCNFSDFSFFFRIHCTGGTAKFGPRAFIFLELTICHQKLCYANLHQSSCKTLGNMWFSVKSGKEFVWEIPEVMDRFCWFTNLTLLFWKYARKPNFIVLGQKLLKLLRSSTDIRTDIAQTYFFVTLCNFVKDTYGRKRFLRCITYFEQT